MFNKKRWTTGLTAVILCLLTITGYLAVSAEYGSQDDPLVTLSYINDVLSPGTMQKIEDAFNAKKTEFDTAIDAKMSDIDQKIAEKLGGLSGGATGAALTDSELDAIADKVIAKMAASNELPAQTPTGWKVVTVPAGKTLVGEVGCEILPRIGTMTCVAGGSPGLINLSSGSDLANGGTLQTNNLYIVTIKGRGAKATTNATILVNGTYTIS